MMGPKYSELGSFRIISYLYVSNGSRSWQRQSTEKKDSVFRYSKAEPHAMCAIYKQTRKLRVLQYLFLLVLTVTYYVISAQRKEGNCEWWWHGLHQERQLWWRPGPLRAAALRRGHPNQIHHLHTDELDGLRTLSLALLPTQAYMKAMLANYSTNTV